MLPRVRYFIPCSIFIVPVSPSSPVDCALAFDPALAALHIVRLASKGSLRSGECQDSGRVPMGFLTGVSPLQGVARGEPSFGKQPLTSGRGAVPWCHALTEAQWAWLCLQPQPHRQLRTRQWRKSFPLTATGCGIEWRIYCDYCFVAATRQCLDCHNR